PPQPPPPPRAPPVQNPGLRARIQARLRLPLEHFRQLIPATQGLQQPIERPQRPALFARELERGPQLLDCARGIAQRVLVDGRQLERQRAPDLGVVLALQPSLVQRRQVGERTAPRR